MRRPVLSLPWALCLALLLLLTQQLGVQHVLSHVLHPGGHGPTPLAQAGPAARMHAEPAALAQAAPAALPAQVPARDSSHSEAADALCQVCLVLAALAAVGLPALWRWRAPTLRAAGPALPAWPAPACQASLPYHARGPPDLPALR